MRPRDVGSIRRVIGRRTDLDNADSGGDDVGRRRGRRRHAGWRWGRWRRGRRRYAGRRSRRRRWWWWWWWWRRWIDNTTLVGRDFRRQLHTGSADACRVGLARRADDLADEHQLAASTAVGARTRSRRQD